MIIRGWVSNTKSRIISLPVFPTIVVANMYDFQREIPCSYSKVKEKVMFYLIDLLHFESYAEQAAHFEMIPSLVFYLRDG